jgi:hypothetical protein
LDVSSGKLTHRNKGPFGKVVGHFLRTVPFASQIAVQICQCHSGANARNHHPLPLKCEECGADQQDPEEWCGDQSGPENLPFESVVPFGMLKFVNFTPIFKNKIKQKPV